MPGARLQARLVQHPAAPVGLRLDADGQGPVAERQVVGMVYNAAGEDAAEPVDSGKGSCVGCRGCLVIWGEEDGKVDHLRVGVCREVFSDDPGGCARAC